MTSDETNVINLRRREASELRFVEIRLEDDYSIEVTLLDNAGELVAVLDYALAARPADFDLDRLREAWERWRSSSAVAS